MRAPAVVLGNGKSRQVLNLTAVKRDAITIGCNVIIREFLPHFVVAQERWIHHQWAKLAKPGPIYVAARHNPPIQEVAGSRIWRFQPLSKEARKAANWEKTLSGEHAICLAVIFGFSPIYLAGFDCDNSNLYSGTDGYHRSEEADPAPNVANQSDRLMRLLPVLYAEHNIRIVPDFIQFGPHTMKWARYEEVPEQWLNKAD